MRPLALALSLIAFASPAVAQSLWERALDPSARRVEVERGLAENEVLLSSLNDEELQRVAPDTWQPATRAGTVQQRLRRRAIARYEGVLRARPDDVNAMTALSLLYDRERDWARVVQHGERALSIDPETPDGADIHFTLSIAHTWLEMHAASRDDYLRQLRYALGSSVRAVALGNLADTYVTLEDLPHAIDAYLGAVAEEPDYALAWLGLAVARDMDHLDPAPDAGRAVLAAGNLRVMRNPFMRVRGTFHAEALIEELTAPGVFFVPTYLVQYHLAVAHEATAREFQPGGRAGADPVMARDHLQRALTAWRAYVAASTPDDPWRLRAQFHARRLEAQLRSGNAAGAGR